MNNYRRDLYQKNPFNNMKLKENSIIRHHPAISGYGDPISQHGFFDIDKPMSKIDRNGAPFVKIDQVNQDVDRHSFFIYTKH